MSEYDECNETNMIMLLKKIRMNLIVQQVNDEFVFHKKYCNHFSCLTGKPM